MTNILRVTAFSIAVLAAIDPSIAVHRARPVAIEFTTDGSRLALDVHRQLTSLLGETATEAHGANADAVVSLGGTIDPEAVRDAVPVSSVTLNKTPNITMLDAAPTSALVAGQQGTIEVQLIAEGVAEQASVLTVTHNAVQVGRLEHTWTGERRQRIAVPFVSVAAGVHLLKVTAVALSSETRDDDNALDVAVTTIERPLKVAVFEGRPSWSAGFVRRALESDRTFEISSLTRASRGVVIRAGDAPAALNASALERFDVILVGAPEELRAADLNALQSFMNVRGGTVVFLPDRLPAGPYASFLAAAGFDEVLVEGPVVLQSAGGQDVLRASELALPRRTSAATRLLASLADGRPVITTWAIGQGRAIYSGALDAWRFRTGHDERFFTTWRSWVASAAMASAPPVEIQPSVAGAKQSARIVARVRQTQLERQPGGAITVPEIRAAVTTRHTGTQTMDVVRVWPSVVPGVFEGRFTPGEAGTYDVHVAAGGAQNAARLLVPAIAPRIRRTDDEEAADIAMATGGVVTTADNLSPLVEHLESLRGTDVETTLYPMRSGWLIVPFALVLCVEWALRRRRGER